MLTAGILIAAAAAGLVLVLLAVIVVAIRQEPRDMEMNHVAPSLTAVMVRRMLGVSLRRPTPPVHGIQDRSPDVRPTAPLSSWRR
jgi:hypothetical protein